MEALEWREELVGVRRIEARAVVFDEVDRLVRCARATDLDLRVGRLRRELPRVPEQVLEGDLEELLVADRVHRGREFQVDRATWLAPAELRDDLIHEDAEIDL